MMKVFTTPADLATRAGGTLGTSDWLTVDQPMIDAFAEATGDRQWIHVDVERARRELAGGSTIAHGYLLLALLPRLEKMIWTIELRSRGLNYGLDRVRFVSPVQAGVRVRLHQTLRRAEAVARGTRFVLENTLEIEGHDRPALVADTIALVYD